MVEVRPPAEILASLDGGGSLDGMPFMPEMLAHVGRRFTVSRRVEKICNNVDFTSSPGRRMRSVVHLDDLRCDGSGHDGCQLACRLYWKEEWLRRVDDSDARPADATAESNLDALARAGTRAVRTVAGETVETYRCQGTEALVASEPLNKFDPRQFARELTSRNVKAPQLVSAILRSVWLKGLRVLRLRRLLVLSLPDTPTSPSIEPVGLQAGDLVRVRSREEVAATLNRDARNRGLSFSPEMVPYCGTTQRVRGRVERLIDEKTGEMIELSRDCVILEDAVCRGVDGCWAFMFCPRGTYPFWREAWLERLPGG
ncbi:MAG: hypothetical protein ACXVZ1_12010 [Gaiellaceae bacterium]